MVLCFLNLQFGCESDNDDIELPPAKRSDIDRHIDRRSVLQQGESVPRATSSCASALKAGYIAV